MRAPDPTATAVSSAMKSSAIEPLALCVLSRVRSSEARRAARLSSWSRLFFSLSRLSSSVQSMLLPGSYLEVRVPRCAGAVRGWCDRVGT